VGNMTCEVGGGRDVGVVLMRGGRGGHRTLEGRARHGLIVECYVNEMVSWLLWHKTDTEPGVAQGLHPGGDVGVGGGHQDLQVPLASLPGINYSNINILAACRQRGHSHSRNVND